MNLRFLPRDFFYLAFALLLRLISPATSNYSYFVLAIYSLTGPKQVIQAFALSWLFSMLNPAIVPYATSAAVMRYLVVFSGLFSIIFRGGWAYLKGFNLWTLFLGISISLHSIVISSYPSVSLLKAFFWTSVMVTLLVSWSMLSRVERSDLERWLFGFLVLILLISLPFLAVPSIGFFRNGSGFQGILNHPQAFGPTLALLGSFSLGSLLLQKKLSVWLTLLTGSCLALILLSQARTAGLAILIGSLLSIFVLLFVKKKSLSSVVPLLTRKSFSVFYLIILVAGLLFAPSVSDLLGYFLSKGYRADVTGLLDAYQSSRSILYEGMINNIIMNPLAGIGFGISSSPSDMNIQYISDFNIPIGASIEKGVLPLAILEELGIIGFLAFIAWVYLLLRQSSINGLICLMLSFTALMINLGESILFSPGGLGMLLLICLSYAASGSSKVLQADVVHKSDSYR